jgi:hypothetical protein
VDDHVLCTDVMLSHASSFCGLVLGPPLRVLFHLNSVLGFQSGTANSVFVIQCIM